MSTLYPVGLELTGRRVVVAGGGSVAQRRVAALLEVGAATDRPGRDIGALLDLYSTAMEPVAREEFSFVDLHDPETALLNAIGGTVLSEPMLLLVRRLAQEHSVRERARSDPPPEGSPGRRWTDH